MRIKDLILEKYVEHLNSKVEKYYNIYHFSMEPNHTSHNNEADAFKHTYMSAELTVYLGSKIAYMIGKMHEDNNKYNTPEEYNMDMHNNSKGIEIGKTIKFGIFKKNLDDIIAEKVMQYMNNGELITTV